VRALNDTSFDGWPAHTDGYRESSTGSFGFGGFGREGNAMSFGLYSIGFLIAICGMIYGAHLMHVPAHWIAVFAIVFIGVGILSGVKATRQRDPVA